MCFDQESLSGKLGPRVCSSLMIQFSFFLSRGEGGRLVDHGKINSILSKQSSKCTEAMLFSMQSRKPDRKHCLESFCKNSWDTLMFYVYNKNDIKVSPMRENKCEPINIISFSSESCLRIKLICLVYYVRSPLCNTDREITIFYWGWKYKVACMMEFLLKPIKWKGHFHIA